MKKELSLQNKNLKIESPKLQRNQTLDPKMNYNSKKLRMMIFFFPPSVIAKIIFYWLSCLLNEGLWFNRKDKWFWLQVYNDYSLRNDLKEKQMLLIKSLRWL